MLVRSPLLYARVVSFPRCTSIALLYRKATLTRSFSSSRVTMATLQNTAFLEAIAKHEPSSTAIVHSLSGRSFTYGSLLQDVAARKQEIAKDAGKDEKSMEGERVAFLIENSYDYVGAPP